MTNDPFPDDSWDELTRELGVEKTPPREPDQPPHNPADPILSDDEAPSDEGEFDGDLGEEGEGEPLDGAESPEGEEVPGRKRRRRRRRRKKGPGEGETEAAGTEEAEEPTPRPARATAPARPAMAAQSQRNEPDFAEGEFDSRPYDDEPVGVPLAAAEEDTAGEVLRELIANWNVPSWDSIITGLNR